jgi:hypothetical protein
MTRLAALAGIALLASAALAVAAAEDAPLFEQPPPGTPNLTGKWV